ncbi:MAG: hypothetical protein JWR84_2848 [Caulobacter sp.]|nr:hypothetical protein [Caulobacter sp.]
MPDIQFTNSGGSIWGGGDLLEVYNTPTISLPLSVPLGYGGDGAFLGAKFTLTLTAGLRFTLNWLAGGLNVGYGFDLPAAAGGGLQLNNAPGVHTSGYSITNVGLGATLPASGASYFSTEFVLDYSADITDIGLTLDYLPDFTLDPIHLFGGQFLYELFRITDSDPQQTFGTPVFNGYYDFPTLPTIVASQGAPVYNGLPTSSGSGQGSWFAELGLNITQLLQTAIPVLQFSNSFDIGPASINYTILEIIASVKAGLKQELTFTPSSIDLDITTTLAGDSDFHGKLGDDYDFELPEAGFGSFDVTETYTLHGQLTNAISLVLNAGLNYKALFAHLHLDVWVAEFDVDVGPVFGPGRLPAPDGYDFPAIPLFTNTFDMTSFFPPQVRTYTVSWEKFYVGTAGADTAPLTPHQVAYDGLAGNDDITGNALANTIHGGDDDDTIHGAAGADTLYGDGGGDIIDGGADNDTLYGGDGVDNMTGGTGDDIIEAGGGATNSLWGEEGNDQLFGGDGTDQLTGEEGDDTVTIRLAAAGFAAHGDLTGGDTGNFDRLIVDGTGVALTHTFSGTAVTGVIAAGKTYDGFELIDFRGGALADIVTGSDAGDELHGGDGGDTLNGGGGQDYLYGDGGADTLNGGLDNDIIAGGDGDDSIVHVMNQGADTIYGGDESQDLSFGDSLFIDASADASDTTITVSNGNLYDGTTFSGIDSVGIQGGGGGNTFIGDDDPNHFLGGGGDDTLDGGGNLDTLEGQDDNDTLISNDADLLLAGGAGIDTAFISRTGGATFVHQDAGGTGVFSDGTVLTSIEVIYYSGGVGADNITSGDGNDFLNGGQGSDILHGGKGADTLFASEYIIPNQPTPEDRLYGEDGNDFIQGGQSMKLASGGAGDDVITLQSLSLPASTFNVTLDGGAGADILNGGVWVELLIGGADDLTDGADTIDAKGGNDQVFGGGGGDVIRGGLGDDQLFGQSGDDSFLAGDGNLFSFGADGNDAIDGGLGIDTYDATDSNSAFDINLTTGKATGQGSDTLVSIENAKGGNSFDKLTGNSGANRLEGGGADDKLFGGGGDDVLVGGVGADDFYGSAGNDTLIGGAAYQDRYHFALGDGADTISGFDLNYHKIYFTGLGLTLANLTKTQIGDDVLLAFTGVVDGPTVLIEDVTVAQLTTFIAGGGVETKTTPTATADTISVTRNVAVLLPFAALTGNDSDADGDQLTVLGVSNPVGCTVSIMGGEIQITATAATGSFKYSVVDDDGGVSIGTVTVKSIVATAGNDNLSGTTSTASSFAGLDGIDNLVGTAGIDVLDGGAGADKLDGKAGGDRMIGGLGNDIFQVDSYDDLTIELAAGGTDTVNTALDFYTLQAEIEAITFTIVGDTTVYGNDSANTLNGTAGINTFYGGGGADTLYGREGADVLDGGEGADKLDGGTGADAMTGGGGDDIFYVDDAGDTVVEYYAGGNDTVQASVSYVLSDEIEILLLVQAGLNGTGNAGANIIKGTDAGNMLDGGDGDDNLYGYNGNDILVGGLGADWLEGGTGTDSMTGGDGDDTYVLDSVGDTIVELAGQGTDTVRASFNYILSADLENLTLLGGAAEGTGNALKNHIVGGANNDILKGMDGDDLLVGGAGSDLIEGGEGNDVLDGGTGADAMNGGNGDDTYTIDNGGDTITDSAGVDTVKTGSSYALQAFLENLTLSGTGNVNGTGNVSANQIRGQSGNNSLTGMAGDDKLTGMAGDDILLGGADNDTLDGGAGADTLTGGIGNDIYYADEFDTLTENNGEGTDTVRVAASFTLGQFFENLTMIGVGNAILTGNAQNNLILGGIGADTLDGLDGDDELSGGAGDDIVRGGLGADILYGKAGADNLKGGDGNDTYNADLDDTLEELAGEGTDTVVIGASYTLLTEFENLTLTGGPIAINGTGNGLANLILGNEGANVLSGDSDNDILRGGLAADTLNGGTGVDTLEGGGGDDLYIVDDSGDVVTELAGEGYDTVQASADYVLGAEAERLELTGSALNGTGNAGGNVLIGNAGNNLLDGGAGADAMTGGDGDDTYVVDNAGDAVTETNGQGDDLVQASIDYTLGGDVERLTLTGAALNGTGNGGANTLTGNGQANTLEGLNGFDTLYGGDGDDILRGGDGNDILDGQSGIDTMVGGIGDDTFYIDDLGDLTVELDGEGADGVVAAFSYTLGDYIEFLTLTGTGDFDGTGTNQFNELVGNSGVNTLRGLDGDDNLDGGAGADILIGGQGNDTYLVDNAGDVTTELDGEGADTVRATVSYTLVDYLENLYLYGSDDIDGTGNSADNGLSGNDGANTLSGLDGDDNIGGEAGDDILIGGKGADFLFGGTGDDAMSGGEGDDVAYVDSLADTVTELDGEGTDEVNASVTWTLGDFTENLTLSGTAAINGTGNALANTLVGNDKDNVLSGGDGADLLKGGDGKDTLDGGDGADTLEGGLGSDTYIVTAGDVVTELSGEGANDTVQAAISWTLGDNLETLVLTGVAAIDGTGNEIKNALVGNGAANVLSGLGGNDILVGGLGVDTLSGGTGMDLFIFDQADLDGSDVDVIDDFVSGSGDKLYLYGMDANSGLAGDQAFAFIGLSAFSNVAGQLRYTVAGADLMLEADVDGDGTADFSLSMLNTTSLTAADFLL